MEIQRIAKNPSPYSLSGEIDLNFPEILYILCRCQVEQDTILHQVLMDRYGASMGNNNIHAAGSEMQGCY